MQQLYLNSSLIHSLRYIFTIHHLLKHFLKELRFALSKRLNKLYQKSTISWRQAIGFLQSLHVGKPSWIYENVNTLCNTQFPHSKRIFSQHIAILNKRYLYFNDNFDLWNTRIGYWWSLKRLETVTVNGVTGVKFLLSLCNNLIPTIVGFETGPTLQWQRLLFNVHVLNVSILL